MAGVAQLVRAPDCGSGGCRFIYFFAYNPIDTNTPNMVLTEHGETIVKRFDYVLVYDSCTEDKLE